MDLIELVCEGVLCVYIPLKISGPCKLTEIRMIEGRRKLEGEGGGNRELLRTKIRERERDWVTACNICIRVQVTFYVME